MNYLSFFTRFYHNNTGYLTNSDKSYISSLNKNKRKVFFHSCCPYTNKQRCSCTLCEPSQSDIERCDFIQALYNGQIDFDFSDSKIKISKKKTKKEKDKMLQEHLKLMDFHHMNEYQRKNNEEVLNFSDYREIEKSINEDKKVCEKCGCGLDGDNYHKGWKNENGDYVLLCNSCSKKYFDGANEIKYDSRRDDYPNMNNNMNNINNPRILNTSFGMNISVPPFRAAIPSDNMGPKTINFQVINSSQH